MNKIEHVYVVVDNQECFSGFALDPVLAEERRGVIDGKTRVFTEEKPWIPARQPPDNGRKVLAVYARRAKILPTLIVARFGSEGKWLTEDHDMRTTYLEEGTVVGWRELPHNPEVV